MRGSRPIACLCAISLLSGCTWWARPYMEEIPRAVAVDEAFFLDAPAVSIQESEDGRCLRVPFDLSVSLAGLDGDTLRFGYLVVPRNRDGDTLSRRELRAIEYALLARTTDTTAGCRRIQRRGTAGRYRLFSRPRLPQAQLAFLREDGEEIPHLTVGVTDRDRERGSVRLPPHDLFVHFDYPAGGRPKLGDQLRIRLDIKEREAGLTELDMRRVNKPNVLPALLLGVLVLGLGTVGVLALTEPD